MKISPVSFNRITTRNTNNLSKQKNQTNNNLNFKSIYADASAHNMFAYAYQTQIDSDFAKLKAHSTRIFRELEVQSALAKSINPNQKTQIKILGCSDGSEAWAYAIMFKKIMGEKAQKNVKIEAIDIAPEMIELAKTGKIVCSDIEKDYANSTGSIFGEESPLKLEGWDEYLTKCDAPENFRKLAIQHPYLRYIEHDPVVNKKIGSGLDWYEVNKEGLPEVTFKQGDMRDYLTDDTDSQNVIYVVANSAGYLLSKNTDEYTDLFRKIKEENEDNGKSTYVVIGRTEQQALSDYGVKNLGLKQRDVDRTKRTIRNMGWQNPSDRKIKKMGVYNYKDTSMRIFKLNSDQYL